MAANIYFSFGARPGSYVLDTPNKLKFSGVPSYIRDALKTSKKLRWAVFGDDDRAALLYEDGGPDPQLCLGFTEEFKSSFPSAYRFITNEFNEDGIPNLSLTLGKDTSLIVCAPEKNNICLESLESSTTKGILERDKLRHVALGVGGAFVIFSGDSPKEINWSLRGNYSELEKLLTSLAESDPSGLTEGFVALNPWRVEEFFLVLANGTVYFRVLDESSKSEIVSVLSQCRDSTSPGKVVYLGPVVRVETGAAAATTAEDTKAAEAPKLRKVEFVLAGAAEAASAAAECCGIPASKLPPGCAVQ